MLSQIISRLMMLFMLICIYMAITNLAEKKKKKAAVWGVLFLLPIIFLIVLVIIYGEFE